ncbi:MAG: GLUG motif-containing protein [Rikenellaceae bacterium]
MEDETYDGYTIDNVVVSGLNGRATVVLSTPLSNTLFYKSVTPSPITVDVANNKTISGGEAQLRFNIMPTVITSDLPIVVTATLTSSDGTKVMLTQSITVESDVEFARSSYNTINCRAMTTTGTEYWSDLGSSSFSSFGGGSGTSSSPYLISTAQHMADLAAGLGGKYLNDHFQLQNDIDLSGRKWSLSDSAPTFYGTFDGNGYKISGLYVDESTGYKGLFYCLSGATIKNLGVSGSVSSSSGGNVGGIAGYADFSSTITDCYFVGSVSGSSSYVGGVVGLVNSSTVTNCYNTASVSGGGGFVGGVVGCATSSPITNCYNTGAVSSSDSSTSKVGGVVGNASDNSHITNCYNTGEVSGLYRSIGGVAGSTSGLTLINCYNLGGVSGNSTGQYIGGVVGYVNTSYIVNSYNQGVVGDGSYVGGVTGLLNSSNLINVYNTGEVSGSSPVGGVIGSCYNSSIANSYYLKDSYSVGVGEIISLDGTATEMEKDEMQSDDFAATLNENATSLLDTYTTICGWTTTTDNYPSLQY